jgi:hypothetical protein
MRHLLCAAAAACLAVALGGAAAGCKDRKSKEDERAAPAPVEGLAAIPSSAQVVIGFDVTALGRSPLVARAIEQMFARDPELEKDLRGIIDECELDPAKHVRRVLLGMGKSTDDVVLVATGTFSEARLAACVGKHAAGEGGQLRTRSIAGRTAYHVEGEPKRAPVYFAFGAEGTVLVSSSLSWLEAALTPGDSVADDPELGRLIELARPEAGMWAAGFVPAEVGQGLLAVAGGEVGAPPRAIFGHVDLGEGLDAELGAEMASEDDAKSLVSFVKPQLAALSLVAQRFGLGRLVQKIEVDAAAKVVYLRVSLSADEVRDLLARIDTEGGGDKDSALEDPEGESQDVQGDASPGDETPVRQ